MAVEWVIAAGVLVGASVVAWGFSAWMTRRIEAAVPSNGRFVDVDGERFHYLDEGKGPPLVMIHGLMGSSRNLTYALSGQLREHFRVITLDRPGSGYSTRHPGTAADLPAQARQIAAFVRRWAWIDRWCWGIPSVARWPWRWPSTIPTRSPG